jgi:tRNA(Ile)-lysidine synthase
MRDEENSPVTAQEARGLFADWKTAPALVLAVSGGPDSMALLWLVARWRKALGSGPQLLAVTVDHGLRPEAAREARLAKQVARNLDVPHRTVRWRGPKPATGLPAAARAARYDLLARAARAHGATHILTAHTQDDQAETFIMRMARGSGLAGLAAMARQSGRDGVWLVRPFLQIPKARLVATLERAKLGFALDPTNHDIRFTRPRLRALMPVLAAEGCDSRNLARLAQRLARANAALELLVDGAERYLAVKNGGARHPGSAAQCFDARDFAALSEEIRLRLLVRIIGRIGHEGPAELGKVEALMAALQQAGAKTTEKAAIRLKQTLAGALVSLTAERLLIEPAPPRRGGARRGRESVPPTG